MSFWNRKGWALTILVLGSFQMLMFLNVYYVPNRFTAFVAHMLGSLDSVTNFMWSIVPMLNRFD